ncbi:MAG: hypothetical protein R6W82_08325, partial [bacterium]
MKKIFRWKALIPLALLFILLTAGWILFLDTVVEWGIEEAGTQIVGARVELDSADVTLTRGRLYLAGLQVTDPAAPMSNLFEAAEITTDLRVWPLLRKKVIVDTAAVRGLRFGTPREVSGALEREGTMAGEPVRRMASWTDRIEVPPFSLRGIGEAAVDVEGLTADSLETVRRARTIAAEADSVQEMLLDRIRSVNPRAEIDSARAFLERLEGATFRSLGLEGTRQAITTGRDLVRRVAAKRERAQGLVQEVQQSYQRLEGRVGSLDEARQADYAYARSLVDVPSLSAPDIGPALFGAMAREQLAPVLKWVGLAEQYMPPGLDPRRRPGPDRVRMSGEDVTFPARGAELPRMLVDFAEVTFQLGEGEQIEDYGARLRGLTSEPAVYGRPLRLDAFGEAGRRSTVIAAVLDHIDSPVRDSLDVRLEGIPTSPVPLSGLGGRMVMGRADTRLFLAREGDRMDVRISWDAPGVRWERPQGTPGLQEARQGSAEWAEAFVWETLEGVDRVRLQLRLHGTLEDPALEVDSNVARQLSASLQDRLGGEVRRAQQQIRARVDEVVGTYRQQALDRVEEVRSRTVQRVEEARSELERLQEQVDDRIEEL